MTGDNDNRADDGVYAALEAMDAQPPVLDVARAATRLRAHGFGAEVDVLLSVGDRRHLRRLRDGLRRMDPAWCALHKQEQLSDEEFDDLLGTLEDLLEDGP